MKRSPSGRFPERGSNHEDPPKSLEGDCQKTERKQRSPGRSTFDSVSLDFDSSLFYQLVLEPSFRWGKILQITVMENYTVTAYLCLLCMVDRIMTPPTSKNILILRNHEYVMLQGKGKLKLQTELSLLINRP